MANKYGLTTTTNTAKTARTTVGRWNDGVKRHTVFTACGTTTDGWGLWNDPGTEEARNNFVNLARTVTGNNALTQQDLPPDGTYAPEWSVSPDTAVGRNANPDLFNWVPISYPAVGPGMAGSLENNWQPTQLSMAMSARMGVEEMIRQIQATPGTFAIVGMSQGAVVVSQVMKALLPGGVLAHRYNDCIAGIAFGNPCRAPGASFPGGIAAPGGGVIAFPNPSDPMTGGLLGVKTPDWWWELTVPGDFFASAPVDTLAGPLLTPAVQALFHTPGSLAVDAAGLSILTTLMVGGGTLLGVLMAAMVRGGVLAVAEQLTAFFGSPDMKKFFSTVAQRQRESAVGILANWVYQQVGAFDIGASLTTLSPVIVPSNHYPNGNPHIRLGVDKPPALPSGQIKAYGPNPAWTISLPGVTGDSTYTEIGTAYLNARGAAVTPR